MAADFCAEFAVARQAFEEASEALSLDLRKICDGDSAGLEMTALQQPAILTAEIAMVRSLRDHFGVEAELFGGHSLGEYSALAAAGVFDLACAARLVAERGRLMQEACPPGLGAMTALVSKESLDSNTVAALIDGLEVDIANHNAANQIVLSGRASELQRAIDLIMDSQAPPRLRAIPLRVSAPFHSRLMAPVQASFTPLLQQSCRQWKAAAAPQVTSNAGGGFHSNEAGEVAASLARQITAPVRWLDNMQCLIASGCEIVEVGPGRPLRGFFASLGVKINSVTNLENAAVVTGRC